MLCKDDKGCWMRSTLLLSRIKSQASWTLTPFLPLQPQTAPGQSGHTLTCHPAT